MRRFFYWCVCCVLIASCASQKEIVYLQGVESGFKQEVENGYELRIQPDDQLGIMINSRDLELAQMFNLPMVSYQTTTTSSGTNRVLGYLVDKDGYIDFPQIGRIKIEGMTRVELTEFIKKTLIDNGLVNDPIVTVQFLNFQISVMGEVVKPGTFEITSDRVTLFDALSRAGDLTIYGQRENVKIIREVKGERVVAEVDLRGSDILDSPYYYLQQNDIVYVQPNRAKAGQREINSNRTVSTYASVTSVVLSLIALVF